MRPWQRRAIFCGALGFTGTLMPRLFWFKRVRLSSDWRTETLTIPGLPNLAVARSDQGHERLIIVAHGFLKGMRNPGIAGVAEALTPYFDVLAFDFPGHGRSEGESDLDFQRAAAQLMGIIDYGRRLGYDRVGVVGYSMGAAAAIIAAAQGAPVDAIVSVSSPVQPRLDALRRHWSVRVWRWWFRMMGTRVARRLTVSKWPIEYVQDVSPVPLLVVHNELDTLVRQDDSEALFAVARSPKHYLSIPRALHASPMASAPEVTDWLDSTILVPRPDTPQGSG